MAAIVVYNLSEAVADVGYVDLRGAESVNARPPEFAGRYRFEKDDELILVAALCIIRFRLAALQDRPRAKGVPIVRRGNYAAPKLHDLADAPVLAAVVADKDDAGLVKMRLRPGAAVV